MDRALDSISINVTWQIYDRSKQEVVETETTTGTGEVAKFTNNGLTIIFDQAFANALTALAEQGTLQKHIGKTAS